MNGRLLALVSLALLPLAAKPARADEAPVPRSQARAFLLGYTLRAADARAQRFTQSVQALQSVDDDQVAGAEVAHLSRRATGLRRAQADAYDHLARLLDSMDAPKPLRDWAAHTATALDSPLAYSEDARGLAKTEPDTAAVLATLDELRADKAEENAHAPLLAAWLKLGSGRLAVWTVDVGSFAADLHAGTSQTLPIAAARRLLYEAPPGSPSDVRGDLSDLIPRHGGNLQDMATVPAVGFSTEQRRRVYEKLLDYYDARREAEKLDGE